MMQASLFQGSSLLAIVSPTPMKVFHTYQAPGATVVLPVSPELATITKATFMGSSCFSRWVFQLLLNCLDLFYTVLCQDFLV